MKNNVIIGLALLTIAFAIFAADTNAPIKLQSSKSPEGIVTAKPGTIWEEGTNRWVKATGDSSNGWFEIPSGLLQITETNAIMALPFVQLGLHQAWNEGAQFAISASIQNTTMVQMKDAAALYKAAQFLRFGPAPGK